MQTVRYYKIDDNGERVTTSSNVGALPDVCPHCHFSINPLGLTGIENTSGLKYKLEIVFQCPRNECGSIFISYYRQSDRMNRQYVLTGSAPIKHKDRDFEDVINKVSEQFPIIYNQALAAEELELERLAGMGYRRAFEFLIKDFLIQEFPDKTEEIKSKMLGQCINVYIENKRIKQIAERAAWLGNDETHYERRWVDKDVNDLKKLIEITVHYISMERYGGKYIEDMQ